MADDERRVPEGRLSRLARLAAAGARSGAGLVLSRSSDRAARGAAEALGNLRGLAAKVGQMASYVDGVVPEAHRAAYESAMGRLRAAAPTSKPEEVRALVEQELGAPIDQLFSEWDETPLASASIGQVHRARVRGSEIEVAVKVQHPGITKALEADLANAGIVEQMAGAFGARRFNSKAVLAVIRQRFREELDYRLEADHLRYFRELHARDDRIHVPVVIAERSSARVLSTELVRGDPFEAACEAEESLRRRYAQTLWRFVFRGNLRGGRFNADPHPGNYIFHEEGRVSFLDFGCVQPISDHHRKNARRMHRAAIEKDEGAFRLAARDMVGSRPGAFEDLLLGYVRGTFETLWNRPYRITRSYAASLVDGFKDAGQLARKLPDAELTPISEDLFFINRLQFGFYSVLARLDVEVDYAAEELSFWEEP